MWKCHSFSGVFTNLDPSIFVKRPQMKHSVKNMICRRWLFVVANSGRTRLSGPVFSLMRQCKFILKNYIPFPDPPTLPCSVWKIAFCRARQPRYHAVDETEAVHKHGGAFSAWSCSRTSFRCRTTLYEFKLHRRGSLWNGLVRRVLSSLGVSFSQQVQMRFAPSNVVRFCSFESNNFFILALFLFNTQLRFK